MHKTLFAGFSAMILSGPIAAHAQSEFDGHSTETSVVTLAPGNYTLFVHGGREGCRVILEDATGTIFAEASVLGSMGTAAVALKDGISGDVTLKLQQASGDCKFAIQ